ncbi:hypothetical protein [Helicobacter canis]|uniref:Poly E-rich protein n=1 Tax=Helicobacter canis NCTC 12740 TaxID=1357399 RepID=V8CGW1_9HELI|nr:hypothetical protein [Helicobacter canis]ETD25956.1 hypothetical protein HMPREF2087_01794 [Helicobacter canis NCTC 12740]
MKIILINTDPMVAKLIEATAKKTGIMLTSYASTDELDVSTLTKDHFVFVDEGALGTDKERIKSIAQDYLSCLLYAKTKALKEFSHIVKKPFLPTEILDILQAELLKVGQDLHNASEVTQEEIAQVDDGPKMPDIDMSALDKLGDFDITQEFDAESPIPPLADSVSTDIADTPSAESEPEQVPQESVDESLGDVDSSTLEQGGLEELDSAINFLEESDMEDLEAIGAGELPAQEDEAGDSVESTEITDSLAAVDSSLGELGEQELDSSSEPAGEPQTEELLESSDTDIALDTSLEQSAQELAGDVVESAQDLEEDLAQDELLETIQEEADSSDPQAQVDDQAGDIAELEAVEEVPSAIELDELESSAQDEVSVAELGEADLAESGAALEQVEDQASDVEQELDSSEPSALDESTQSAQGGESAAAEPLEEQAECEVLPQDELTLVKNLLEETAPAADTAESLESTQEPETEIDLAQELESSALEDDSESGDGANDESELESSTQEFADIELDDLAQVEPESSAQEAIESAGEDYLQLSESEICQALGEDLPDVESSASTEAANTEIEAGDVESSAEPSELETLEEQASEQLESTQEQEAVEEQAIEEIAEVAENEAVAMKESGGDLQEDTEEAADPAQSTQEQEIESMQESSQDSSDEELESKESAQAEVALEEDLGDGLEKDLAQDLAGDLGDLEESAAKDLEEDLAEELEVSSELESIQEADGQDLAQELESKEALDSMVAHDLQELEAEPMPDQGALQDLGEFGTGLQAINALRDEMQALGDLDPFASDGGDTPSSPAQADDRPSTTQANQTQAQLFSELLANKSAQEIRSLLNGAQISINISFSDKI